MINNKKILVKITGALLLGTASAVNAANWLMLQGTEPAGASARARVWGFIQAQYQDDNSDPNAKGGYNPPKLIGPNLDDQSQFNVNRARLGVRGTGFPLDSKVNYFLLAEFGNNGITAGDKGKTLTDASITLNYIPGARVRMGLFKYPGAEEGLQAIHVFDYINFTSVTNQLLLERFPDSTCDGASPTTPCVQGSDVNNAATPTPDADMNQFSRSVGAFRDVGVQVFDAFKAGSWENSYAIMYGNGNGLNYGDNDENKDLYLYLSSENVFAGKGPRREGFKMFIWYQDGKRTNPLNRTQSQDRTRSGLGFKYLDKPFRVSAEYMQGKGMIFQGQHRPRHMYNDLEASGYYVEGGWYIPNSKWEIDLRYDSYTRDENFKFPTPPPASSKPGDETTFDTTTIGAQYHFNKKTRVNVDYAMRDAKSDTAAIDANVKGIKDRFAIQVTHIF
jgi:hypothetical protein